MTNLSLDITKRVLHVWKLIRKPSITIIIVFCLFTVGIYSISHLTLLTGWSIDSGQYKLIIETKGNVRNVIITEYMYSFNTSTSTRETPYGVTVETGSRPGEYSWLKVHIENLTGQQRAIITLQNIKPTEPLSVDGYTKFIPLRPNIEGELYNCTYIFSHFSVQANSPFGKITVYSNSMTGRVRGGVVQWDFEQWKTKTFTVAISGMLFSSAILSSLIISASSYILKKRFDIFPIVTFIIVALSLFIYVFIGVGNDFLSMGNLNDSTRFYLSLLSPIFHADYSHLMGNVMFGLLISGSLLEIYFRKKLVRYSWYFSPVPISIFFSALSLFLSGYLSPSIGASFWIIGLTIALVMNIFDKRTKLTSIWDFLAVLFVGYLIISMSWNYIANFFIYYFSEETRSISQGHLFFFVVYLLLAYSFRKFGNSKS